MYRLNLQTEIYAYLERIKLSKIHLSPSWIKNYLKWQKLKSLLMIMGELLFSNTRIIRKSAPGKYEEISPQAPQSSFAYHPGIQNRSFY